MRNNQTLLEERNYRVLLESAKYYPAKGMIKIPWLLPTLTSVTKMAFSCHDISNHDSRISRHLKSWHSWHTSTSNICGHNNFWSLISNIMSFTGVVPPNAPLSRNDIASRNTSMSQGSRVGYYRHYGEFRGFPNVFSLSRLASHVQYRYILCTIAKRASRVKRHTYQDIQFPGKVINVDILASAKWFSPSPYHLIRDNKALEG